MRDQESLPADTALSVEELPAPPCGTPAPGETILCGYGAGPPRPIRATTPAGLTFDLDLPCVGIASSAICYEHPPLRVEAMQGYWDVPCSGEAPDGCATPLVPDADAVAHARPLVIDSLDVRVGPLGHHELEIGHAVLPNGILSHASATLDKDDETQHGFVIDPMYVRLQVEPLDPQRPPFDNVYERGRIPGVEEVKVVLVFDVAEASPDATVHIDDIEVR